jgi:hypothetical protein
MEQLLNTKAILHAELKNVELKIKMEACNHWTVTIKDENRHSDRS